jgi:hypothetical protein
MRAVRERTVHDDAWFWTTSMISTSTPCRDLDRRRRPGHHGHHDARRLEGLQLWVHVHRTPRCVLGYWLALCPVPAVRLTLGHTVPYCPAHHSLVPAVAAQPTTKFLGLSTVATNNYQRSPPSWRMFRCW